MAIGRGMLAPSYPPATAYEAPVGAAYRLSLGRVSTAELQADPQAWAIVTRHVPAMKFLVAAPGVKMLLGNMTVLDFGMFGVAPPAAAIAAADAELAALPLRGGVR